MNVTAEGIKLAYEYALENDELKQELAAELFAEAYEEVVLALIGVYYSDKEQEGPWKKAKEVLDKCPKEFVETAKGQK